MKKILMMILSAVFGLTMPAEEFNVKEFGAAGDGKKDDTAAVQAAADAAIKAGKTNFDHRSIYFPPGTYRINGSIKVKNISLRGSDAVIKQFDPAAITFDYSTFWSVRVTGITFIGGKGQVSLVNGNQDKSLLFVDHCRFFNCGGTALETRHGAQSVLFTVHNCEFIRCICSIDSDSDWTVIRDTWIMNDEKMSDSATIVNRDNLLGVPLCNGNNQRWIDNYGSLSAIGCRFGAEGGGFTPVYNFRKYAALPQNPTAVVLRDCKVAAHTSRLRNCAVYCVEIPNLISLENCRATLAGGIVVNPELKMDEYFMGDADMFAFCATGNVGFRKNVLPSVLEKPKVRPIPHPAEHLHGEVLEQKIRAYQVTPSPGTCEVNALTLPDAELVLDNYMDGSNFRNEELLAIVRKARPACLMRRWDGKRRDAPFAELRHVQVDLDKTPWLLMDFRSASPAEFAIKFIDEETGKLHTFRAQQRPPGKLEINLPQAIPAFRGKKTLTFLIYYIGQKYIRRQGEKAHHYQFAEAGSVLEIHELGFNSRSRLTTRNQKGKRP